MAAEAVVAGAHRNRGILPAMPRALSQAEIDHYREHGWLRIERVFEGEELDALDRDLDWLIADLGDEGRTVGPGLAKGLHGCRDREASA